MDIYDNLHGSYIFPRRVKMLSEHISKFLPADSKTLDVGCGDGLISKNLSLLRPDISISGIDVLLRKQTHIPVKLFDGEVIPFEDNSMDTVLFVDVLHHSDNPTVLIQEAKRVARKAVIIKDHNMDGIFAEQTLILMDKIGNLRYDVSLPYNYMREKEWQRLFNDTGLCVKMVIKKLSLYPWFINWIFGRSLHFIAILTP